MSFEHTCDETPADTPIMTNHSAYKSSISKTTSTFLTKQGYQTLDDVDVEADTHVGYLAKTIRDNAPSLR